MKFVIPRSFGLAILVFALALVTSSTASADDFDRRGAYIGVNGVYGLSLFKDEIKSLTPDEFNNFSVGDSPGVNARIGYRIFSWLAMEAEYEWMQSMDLSYSDFGTTIRGEFKPNTITGNLKIIMPTWRLQPYLIAGAGVALWKMEIEGQETSSTGFAGRAGLGLDTYLSKNWVFNLEATGVLNTNDMDPSNANVDLDAASISHLYYFSLSAGVTYRF